MPEDETTDTGTDDTGTDEGSDDTDTDESGGSDDAESSLGDAGKKALRAERKARKDAERRVRELAAAAAANGDSDAPDVEALVKAAREETSSGYRNRIVSSMVEAVAARKKLIRPADAAKLLDLADFDGDTDPDDLRATIEDAIDELTEEAPYLVGPKGDGDGDLGAKRKSATKPPRTRHQRLADAYSDD